TMTNDPEHNLFNWIASSVAVALIVMTGILGIAARREADAQGGREGEQCWCVLMLVSAVATVLMIRPSSILWVYLFKLRFVQFPWRWMAILAVPYAFFLALTVRRRPIGWVWIFAAMAMTAGTATLLVETAWWDSEDIPVLEEAIRNDQGYEGVDEYDPIGD